MTKNRVEVSSSWVPAVGDTVTFLTPQRKEIPSCKVVRLFDGRGRIRVKALDGTTYSGTLDQVKP